MSNDDGRGQVTHSRLERILRYLMANPLVGLVGVLLGALGVAGLKRRHLEASAARAQKRADLARLKLSRDKAESDEKVHASAQEAVNRTIRESRTVAEDAKDRADTTAAKLRDIGKRWPTGVILVAALWMPALGAEQALPDACASQPDLTGLAGALTASEARFAGLDRLMVEDAAGALSEYRALVAALCDRIGAQAVAFEAASEGRTLALGALAMCSEDRTSCWTEAEARINHPVILRRPAFLSCVAGPIFGVGSSIEPVLGAGVGCGFSLWPK